MPICSPIDADHHELHAADREHADNQGRVAGNGALVDQRLDQHPAAEHQGGRGEYRVRACWRAATGATENEVRPSTDKPISERTPQLDAPCSRGARIVVDPKLAKADPRRQSLEEAIALRQPPQGRRGARRQQPKVASVRRDFLAGAPVDQGIETFSRRSAVSRIRSRDGLSP